jgi:hypothetical protein
MEPGACMTGMASVWAIAAGLFPIQNKTERKKNANKTLLARILHLVKFMEFF